MSRCEGRPGTGGLIARADAPKPARSEHGKSADFDGFSAGYHYLTNPGQSRAADEEYRPRSGGMRQFTVRARMIDRKRKLVRQHLGNLVDGNVIFGGELPHG